jgi:hypothetical protein
MIIEIRLVTLESKEMKHFLFILAVILISGSLYSQDSTVVDNKPTGKTFHVYKDASIALAPAVRWDEPVGTSFAGSLKMKMFLGRRWSFDTELVFGKDYMTFGPGIIGIPLWLLGFPAGDDDGYSFNDLIFVGVISALTAEHIAYHIPLKNFADLSPYVSLLRFRAAYGNNPENPYLNAGSVCFGAGLELNKYFNKFVLSPYVEYSQAYTDNHGTITAGLYFGFYIFN